MPDSYPKAAIELRLNGRGGVLEAAGAAVRAVATSHGLDPDRATRLRVVVEELVREARDRERVGEGDDVVLRVHTEAGRLHVEVADLAAPTTAADSRRAPSRRLAALGFVDELHIGSRGRAGNVAECAVALGTPRASLFAGEEVLDASAPDASKADAEALEIRPMEPGDAIGLARCIYRCYGYTYKDSWLYESRHIARAVRALQMISTVAVRPDREVVGHSALSFERRGDPIPEGGKLVVDPRFRGHHLAERMASVRSEDAARRGLMGYWAQAVTNHPGSQKELLRFGGAEVGLLIGGSPSGVKMAALENPTEGRRSLVAMYVPISRVARDLHLPERHHELIGQLAGRLGLERSLHDETSTVGSGATGLQVGATPEAGLARIRVHHIGADVTARVADELDGLDAFDLGAVHLDIPLAEPAAARAIEELERLGFSFAAWLPNFAKSGDVLRLQRVGGHPVDTGHVVCARVEGEALRDCVLAEWQRVRRGG